MIDLNEIDEAPSRYDLREIRERLADTAYNWVPALFSNGRISPDRKTLRCADLTGRAPRGEGSCVINLTGPHAGCGIDFATGERGGPIDLIAYATGLSGRALFDEAARIACVDRPKPPARPTQTKDHSAEINRIMSGCVPLAGTLGAHYLSTRELSDPECLDLLFNPDVNDYARGISYPAIIAVLRDQDGNRTGGIHRTFLERDGASKAPSGKKMLGPILGGSVQLASIGDDGHVGLAEGLETALSVTAIFDLPCWATLSREHLIAWNCPSFVKVVTIYADNGQPGIEAAQKLAERLRKEGKPCTIKLPKSEDDFNTDLMRGFTAKDYPIDVESEVVETAAPRNFSEFATAIKRLPQPVDTQILGKVLSAIADAQLGPLEEGELLRILKGVSRRSLDILKGELAARRKDVAAKHRITPPWAGQLQTDIFGNLQRNEANIIVALKNDPVFAGAIVFDEFRCEVMITKPLPWDDGSDEYPRPWKDEDDVRCAEWLQWREVNAAPNVVSRSVSAISREMKMHPVREYLEHLQWDQRSRLDRWAIDYLGAEDTSLNRAFGSLWMISAVARIMKPGAKVDHMLILEGEQGLKKSTALKNLAGEEWFTDEIAELGSKDAAQQMRGVWIIEIAELDAMSRAEVSGIKAFLTRTVDRYRPPYGRYVISVPRQCVFAGSVNPDTYLRDETGNRRFWPILCGDIDLVGIERDRDQLWAEAVVRYEAGSVWWLTDPDIVKAAKEAQDARYQGDAWDELIDDWIFNDGVLRRLEPVSDVSIADVMEKALRLEPGKWSRADQMRVSAYLKRNGWERYKAWSSAARSWRYRKDH